MGKDFDALRTRQEQRDRNFIIGGREWHVREAIPARTVTEYVRVAQQISRSTWPDDTYDVLNGSILTCLEPSDHEAWREMVANGGSHPVTVNEMLAIMEHCIEATAERPTSPPSPSGTTGGSGTTTSTDGSGSPAAPEPAASTSRAG